MRLITWNCQGAFRKKAEIILKKLPDILVIQECEKPDSLFMHSSFQKPNDLLWFGDNKHKGLCILSYGSFAFELLKIYNPALKYVVPILVKGETMEFTLFAIWANNREDKDGQYVEQVWKAINFYEEILNNEQVILTGDFNSNTIWDKPKRIGNHSTVVEKLALKNVKSIYHKYFNQEQGKEEQPTFFLHKNRNKPYHIDYCFTSRYFSEKLKYFEVGSFEDWILHSDHAPLIIEFDCLV